MRLRWDVGLFVLALVLLPVLAGCIEEAPGPPSYEIGGVFTEDTRQEDVADLDARVAALGGTMVVMESYPMQYRITVADGPTCDEVRAMLEARAYIAEVGRCQAVARP